MYKHIEETVFRDEHSKILAAIFAFFLGGFGIHHFYLGNKGYGILYLIFSWTFIPTIIAFIEGIHYLLMDQEEFDIQYNSDKAYSTTSTWEGSKRANNYYKEEEQAAYSYKEEYSHKEPTTDGRISIADEIEKLHDLMLRGIISEREFAERKDRL